MINEIILDTRELEAPEPIGVVMSNLKNLTSDTYIKMIHRFEPKMLYTHLLKNNFQYKVNLRDDIVYLFIWSDNFKDKNIFKGM